MDITPATIHNDLELVAVPREMSREVNTVETEAQRHAIDKDRENEERKTVIIVTLVLLAAIFIASAIGGSIAATRPSTSNSTQWVNFTTSSPTTLSLGHASPPTIFHDSSAPVSPGQAVVATGSGWTETDSLFVVVTRIDDGIIGYPPVDESIYVAPIYQGSIWSADTLFAEVIEQTSFSIAFRIPLNFSVGIFAYQIWNIPGKTRDLTLTQNRLGTEPTPMALAGTLFSYGSSPAALGGAVVISGWRFLNLPQVWHVDGDQGRIASAAGWMAVHGPCVQLTSNAASSLVLAKTSNPVQQTSLQSYQGPSRVGSLWTQYFSIPSSYVATTYYIWVHNGYGGTYGWTRFQRYLGPAVEETIALGSNPRISNPTIASVTLTNSPTISSQISNAFKTTLKKGGLLYFPSGTYHLNQTLIPPSNVVIRGAGSSQTFLVFDSISTPPYYFISSTSMFGVESLTIRAGLTSQTKAMSTNNNCVLDAAIFKSGTSFSWITNVVIANATTAEAALAQPGCQSVEPRLAVGIRAYNAENLIVDTVTVSDALQGVSVEAMSNYTRWDAVSITYRVNSALVQCGMGHVFNYGTWNLAGDAASNNWNSTTQPGFLVEEGCPQSLTRDVYVHGMTSTSSVGRLHAVSTAGVGTDGWYLGYATSSSQGSVQLAGKWSMSSATSPPSTITLSNSFDLSLLAGSTVAIVGGLGVGQIRYLAGAQLGNGSSSNNAFLTLSSKFDVDLDGTSIVSISKTRGRMLLTNNDFGAEGRHTLASCSSGDVIYANNILSAPFTDPSSGTVAMDGNVGPATLQIDACNTFTSSGAQIGLLSGSWYSAAIGNTVRSGSQGLTISFSQPGFPQIAGSDGGTPVAALWPTSMATFGYVVQGNVGVNGASPLSIQLSAWSGVSVVDNNVAVHAISWTQGASTAASITVNSGEASSPNTQLICAVVQNTASQSSTQFSCGSESTLESRLEDCEAHCGTPVRVVLA